MVSEAQKRASAKYQREKTARKAVVFYPGDAELLEWLNAQGNAQGYIKRLIREDMERGTAMGLTSARYVTCDRCGLLLARHRVELEDYVTGGGRGDA